MNLDLQPAHLKNELVSLSPLAAQDFEKLYAVASDPLIWEQHPNKDRYKREVFQNFFKGAMESGGAFIAFDAKSGQVIGSSRFYEYDKEKKSIAIGYTFLARDHWGGGYNRAMKTLMLDHAFTFVNRAIFHVGAQNLRSQKAMEKLAREGSFGGAKKIGELEMEYYGEPERLNFVYEITKTNWLK